MADDDFDWTSARPAGGPTTAPPRPPASAPPQAPPSTPPQAAPQDSFDWNTARPAGTRAPPQPDAAGPWWSWSSWLKFQTPAKNPVDLHEALLLALACSLPFMVGIVAAGLVAASTSAYAADITGAGSTFIYPVLSKWADSYRRDSGDGVNYQSIGSGAGIKQVDAKTVTFEAQWKLVCTLDAILLATGFQRYPNMQQAVVPGTVPGQSTYRNLNNAWVQSMQNISGWRSWLAPVLDPNGDVIVDFGSTGPPNIGAIAAERFPCGQ